MGSYVMCGHYLSNVPAGGTVSLSCSPWNLPPARYVIVQFPIVDQMNFCELEVCARGEPFAVYHENYPPPNYPPKATKANLPLFLLAPSPSLPSLPIFLPYRGAMENFDGKSWFWGYGDCVSKSLQWGFRGFANYWGSMAPLAP